MALTLVEAAKETRDNLTRAVIELFAQSNDMLRMMPFTSITGNALKYNQEDTLPGVGFRGVNEGFTEAVGVLNPQTENLAIAGGDLDVDRFVLQTMGEGRRATHVNMKIKNLAHTIGHKMLKGDTSTDPKEFDGLQKRLGGNQLVSNGTAALSLLNMDLAIDRTDDPNAILMSQAMARRFSAAARSTTTGVGANLEMGVDEFGRRVTRYQGLPILIADRNQDVFASLDFSEASSTTSIYVLSFGEGKLEGIQNGAMDVRDLGELQSGTPAMRTRIEWYVGMVLLHPRAATRLSAIQDGAIVA